MNPRWRRSAIAVNARVRLSFFLVGRLNRDS